MLAAADTKPPPACAGETPVHMRTTYGFSCEQDGAPQQPPGTPPPRVLGFNVSQGLSASPGVVAGAVPPPPAPNDADGHVGWKGLVEMSRSTGVPGNLNARRKPEGINTSTLDAAIEVVATAHPSPNVRRLVKSVTRGLRACQEPEAAKDGMGGTYFFCNEGGRKSAILKPCDEEPLAPNNPKGYVGRSLGDPGWKPTVRVGEAAIREVAAHLLDHDSFARVPTSVLVRARHPTFCYNSRGLGDVRVASGVWSGGDAAAVASSAAATSPLPPASQRALPMKLGSLQEFVPHQCDTSEMGPSRFSVSDVHRIGILDVRLFNTDRHAGNMLVRQSRDASASAANLAARVMPDSLYELIPIDHGFCLPETLDAPYFEWLHWPQAMLPFSDDELEYIHGLDAAADAALLARELPILRPECVRVLELTTALLKRCAEAGMTLYEIGTILSRPFEGADEEPSELERMCAAAKAAHLAMDQIAEEDEAEEDEADDGGDSDEAMELALAEELSLELANGLDLNPRAAAAAAAAAPSRLVVPPPRVESSSSRAPSTESDTDLLMFELDGDAAAGQGGAGAARALPGALSVYTKGAQTSPTTFEQGGGSPSTFSVGSSSMSSLDFARGAGALAPSPSGAPAAGSQTQLACSVHGNDGFAARMRKRAKRVSSRRHLLPEGSPTASRTPAHAASYPPPVVCASGDINFGEFDAAGWGAFKREVLALVDASIACGRWRKDATGMAPSCGVAMSCPRF